MKSKLTLLAFLANFIAASSFAAPVNINTASVSEIAQSLSGVGTTKAQAIVEYREQNGQFKSAGDIVLVNGIGQSTYVKNKQDILVK